MQTEDSGDGVSAESLPPVETAAGQAEQTEQSAFSGEVAQAPGNPAPTGGQELAAPPARPGANAYPPPFRSSGSAADDPFGAAFDEDFVRGAAFTEESAKTREAQAARVRKKAARQQRRQARKNRRSAPSAADVFGHAPEKEKTSKTPTIRVVVFFVICAALIGALFVRPSHAGEAAGAPNPWLTGGSASAGADAQVSCEAGAPGCGSMSQPFAESPAETYADGADGIVLPAAAATAHFSTSEVATDLQIAKQFLIGQDLEPAVVFQGAFPSDAVALLDPDNGIVQGIRSEFAHPAPDNDPTGFVPRFDPASAVQIGSVIKVNGTMSFSEPQKGILAIDADYLFVYPVHKPGSDTWTRVDVRESEDLNFSSPAYYRTVAGRLYTDNPADGVPGALAGAEGGFHNGFLIPDYPGDDGGVAPSGTPIDPFQTPTAPAAPAVPGPAGGAAVVFTGASLSPTAPGSQPCGSVTRT